MEKSFRTNIMFVCLGLAMLAYPFLSSAQDLERIKPEELKKLIETRAEIVVVDTQPKGAYDLGHIPGAINFPWTTQIKPPLNLPRNKVLIIYCACSHEEDSTDMAKQLIEFGYNKSKVLEGGWLQWQQLGYPTAK